MNRRPAWPPASGRAAPQVSGKLVLLVAERSDEQAYCRNFCGKDIDFSWGTEKISKKVGYQSI